MKKNSILRIAAALFSRRLLFFYSLLIFLSLHQTLRAQCGTAINTFPYTEDFEGGPAWTMGGTNSSWAWGSMAHPIISSAGGGTKSWCSGGLTGSSYSGAQQSWVMSPCFDFTNLNYPWVSFKLFWECEYQWDGLVFQYSLNGGSTWLNVGAAGDPVNCLNANWYNYSNISNLTQASPKHGWCGRVGATSGSCAGGNGSLTWVTAKHCMSNLARQSNVRFRFLFGSGTTCNSYDGIAFDDITIRDALPNAADFSYGCTGVSAISFTNLSTQCPTSFVWNFGDPTSGAANNSTLQNPNHTFSNPGTYMVSLTASGPCNAPSTTIIPVSILSLSTTATNPSCNGYGNGSFTVTASGGIPVSYTWSPSGGNSAIANGLAAGIYTVSVKDQNNCLTRLTTTITQPPPIAVTLNTVASCVGGSNGSISAVISGGLPAYSYTWSPVPGSSGSISGLNTGTYSVNITDANNCPGAGSAYLYQPVTSLNGSILSNSPTCGAPNGNANATITGGTPGYNYVWFPSGGSQSNALGLTGGTYSLTVTDNNNCSIVLSTIIAPSTSVSLNVITNAASCYNLSNGSAFANVSGGISPYTYTWNPPPTNGQGTSAAGGLAAGNYSVQVRDVNNCNVQAGFVITSPLALSINYTTTNVSCFGGGNGAILLQANGGTPAYSFSCNPFGNISALFNNLVAGNYVITASDAANCHIDSVITVTQPPLLTAIITHTDVLCNGGLTGAAKANIFGGTPGYTYIWAPTGGTQHEATGLASGTYSVVIQDTHNCSLISTVTLTQPNMPITGSAAINTVSCFGGSDGSATITPGGGTPGYTFMWGNPSGNVNFTSGLATGVHSVVITDHNNCSATITFSVNEPPPLSVTASAPKFCSNQPGVVSAVTNGTATPFIYSWNGVPSPNNSISLTLTTTTVYNVSITDAKGCVSNNDTILINIPPPMSLNSNQALSVCQGQNAMLSANATGGDGNYSFIWQPGGLIGPTHTIPGTSAQLYMVSVTDGCSTSISKTVAVKYFSVPSAPISYTGKGGCAPVCISFSNDSLLRSDMVSEYFWHFGDTVIYNNSSPVRCYNNPGDYVISLSYITVNGCSGKQNLTDMIHVDPQPAANFTTDKPELDAYDPTAAFINLSKGATSYNWYFNNDFTTTEENPSYTFLNTGGQFITLVAVNEFGCENTVTKILEVKPEFTFYAPNCFSPNDDNLNDVFLPVGIGWNTSGFELNIFDRWGEKVFVTKNGTEGWNGKVRGSSEPVQNGIYIWKVFMYDVFNKYHEYIGQVLMQK